MAVFLLMSCSEVAPTVERYPSTKEPVVQESSTLRPQIQLVYPGALQSLDYPESYPTEINPAAADIIIVFSHIMENSDNDLETSLELLEDGVVIPVTISPINPVEDPTGTFLCARSFIVSPVIADELYSEKFKENSVYTLKIYKFAHVNNDPERSLNFENLVELPATSLDPVNPAYVEYTFRTGMSAEPDTEPPVLHYSDPDNGAANIDPAVFSGGYFELVFSDNIIPMINPATVDINTLSLVNITDTIGLSIKVELDTGDTDFKTFRVYPLDALYNGKEYRLRVSVDNAIEDFQGNPVIETGIQFTTEQ